MARSGPARCLGRCRLLRQDRTSNIRWFSSADKIMKKGRELYGQGKYRLAFELLNKLIYAEPSNQAAKDLLADAYEQMGYQFESPSLRNSFLAAAKELRDGVIAVKAAKAGSPDATLTTIAGFSGQGPDLTITIGSSRIGRRDDWNCQAG